MPRKIIGAAFLSLDGVVQAPGALEEDRSGHFAHGGWLAPVADESIDETIGPLFSRDFALLLGRRTYEIFAAYWPIIPMDDPIAAAFAKCEKFVLSRKGVAPDWQGSKHLADLESLRAVKSGEGPDLIVQGSSTLNPQLLAAGLLDRLTLIIAPVVLGEGKRLFCEGTPPVTLKLVEQSVGSRGVITATYEPAGPVVPAAIGPEQMNPLERRRRERIAEGTW